MHIRSVTKPRQQEAESAVAMRASAFRLTSANPNIHTLPMFSVLMLEILQEIKSGPEPNRLGVKQQP